MMLLADCYRVPRLGVPLDLLGYVAPAVAAPSYRCWCSFVSASFAGLVTHSTHKHGFRRTAYNYVTEFGDCFGCLKTFHTKRRLLDHLTRTKNPICLNRIISNYAPMYDAGARAKYGHGSAGSAIYRNGPPRDEDRWPIFVKSGPLLDVGCRSAAMGPSGLAFTIVPAVVVPDAVAPTADVGFLLQNALERLVSTVDFFVLNLCCGHRRAGDIADLCTRAGMCAGFRLWIVSVDIVSGNPEHNLASVKRFQGLLKHLRAGRVHAWIIGPPCETWSRARFRAIVKAWMAVAGRRSGPRPLRSPETP